jgi:hypothetical protein
MPATSKPSTEPAVHRPLSDIVDSIVVEIRQLATLVDGFHIMPTPRIDGGTVDPNFIRQMQMVDRVNQRLNGLADFLGALRNAMPGEWQLDTNDALQIIKLHNLALQLGLDDEQPGSQFQSSDCQFF